MTVNGELQPAVNGHGEPSTPRCEVCVVGAGPAGLMLASNLVRLGIHTKIIDERPTATSLGRADGLQPKTLETLRMMRLGDNLVRLGTKVYDICMWASTPDGSLVRSGRELHYPAAAVDLLDPYILLCHQGMVEDMFIQDLRFRGVEVDRSTKFSSCSATSAGLSVECKVNGTEDDRELEKVLAADFAADYVVGCDGAHSQVRRMVPEAYAAGTPHDSLWGVLDGEVDTDFPDIWSKTVVHAAAHGSILVIPRERNKTRLYIEIKGGDSSFNSKTLGQEYVMQRASEILAPYRISWRSVEWFGRYQVAQRVANRFVDAATGRIFLAGDASHAHSPKAAQGMNTSMHDTWNLAWKMNLALRGLALPALLETYEAERKKIAHDLIDFDVEHASEIARGDAAALAKNFRKNTAFIAGVGVAYAHNVLNPPDGSLTPLGRCARPGSNPPPAKVMRYIDANPVDIQTDIPALGQFKVFLVVPDLSCEFLATLCSSLSAPTSLISRLTVAARRSYAAKPRTAGPEDDYFCPERYTSISDLFTFALITSTDKSSFEIAHLPPILASSPWTIYLDDAASLDTQGRSCIDKWLGGLSSSEAAIINVRPDGYVGSVRRVESTAAAGVEAAQWMDEYYGGFLQAPW
ncbi:hypothetical protein Sste5346_006901 [Sporothrix stenoceras]|uniref:FAD binding domain-containing protein n=1 Tax=Sporothrix stenoceras TaxID=5173 RepID=A0ABR3YXI0_9PEZI